MHIDFESYNEKYQLTFSIKSYDNNNLAILIMCKDSDGFVEPFATMTTNICTFNNDTLACIDTNNFPEALDLIDKYNLGTYTGKKIPSGYCEYPVYDMNLNEIKKYEYVRD